MEEITRAEIEEIKARFAAEENRQNHRLDILEGRVDKLIDMVTSVSVMQEKINTISDDIKKLAVEVDQIKQEPADKWNRAVWVVITVFLTAIATYLISGAIGG